MNANVRRIVRWSLLVLGLITSGIMVAALVGVLVGYGENHWLPSWRWVGFVGFTVILFATAVGEFRRRWSDARLWLCLAGALAVHTAIYAGLLTAVTEWRVIWFAPLTIGEFFALAYVLDRVWRRLPAAR
jgi:hypothetical protein